MSTKYSTINYSTINYLSCNVKGGLGNQLFEIATVLSYAKKISFVPVFIYKKEYDGYVKRPNYWSTLFRLLKTIPDNTIKFSQYFENSDQIYAELPIFHTNTMLDGYFQSSKYFSNNCGDDNNDGNNTNDAMIRNLICLDETDKIYVKDKMNIIREKYKNKTLISIHFRRTDYCKLGWQLNLEYYHNALKHFDLDNCVFIIFTDDPKWVNENFNFLPHSELISDVDYLELFMIGECDSHIIANSTFCWWGVWFGDINKNKKVIAPAKWIPINYNKYIFEKHWVLI
jgi:hypothetical protein